MAGKRQATSDLNHDNWDREEEPEDRGTFRTATEDELKNRVIKKAKRKIAPGASGDAADGSSGTKSVFSGFSGFGKSTASATVAASSSPFSFLSKITAVATATTTTSSTSGIVSSSTTTTASATPTFSFGSSTATTTVAKITESSKPTSTFSFGTSAATSTPSSAEASAAKVKDNSFSFSSSSEYYKKLSSLNQAVSEWIKTHVDKNPVCILSPIFKDYEKYLKEIEEEKKMGEIKKSSADVKENKDKPPESSVGVGSFKFSSSSSAKTDPTSTTESTAKTNGFSFGLKKAEEEKSPAKPAFTPSFSFGLKPPTSESPVATASSTTAPSSGFSFGNLANTSANTPAKPFSFTPGATPFSFGNIKPPAPDTAASKDEDEDEEPPKNEFKQVVEEDAVYSKKCKVFVKKDGNFADKGVGTLYLKPVESSGKTQLLVRADTNLGNILVNLILNSSIPAQRMGKNNVMMVCLPTPDVEKPTSMLLRVKTGEEADELLENIDKYKK